jgi:dynein heavy chain
MKANEALEQLTKRDIGEVKAYVHPPYQVEKVMKALMVLKGKEDTWEEAKKDLANVDFIKTLTVSY